MSSKNGASLVNTPGFSGRKVCRNSATFLADVRLNIGGLAGTAVTTRIVMFSLGILVSGAAMADDLDDWDTTELQSAATYTLYTLPADLTSEPQWRLPDTASEIVYSNLATRPMFEVEFRDSNTLKQLSKLRNLSFLTLADKWNSQLFLGVNRDGLVGLHFTLLPRRNKDQMLELSRLPYLKDTESLAEADTAE